MGQSVLLIYQSGPQKSVIGLTSENHGMTVRHIDGYSRAAGWLCICYFLSRNEKYTYIDLNKLKHIMLLRNISGRYQNPATPFLRLIMSVSYEL